MTGPTAHSALRRAYAPLLALALLSPVAFAGQEPLPVPARVLHADGRPAIDVPVRLARYAPGRADVDLPLLATLPGRTDESGRVRLELPAGQQDTSLWRLEVLVPARSPQVLELRAGEEERELRLDPMGRVELRLEGEGRAPLAGSPVVLRPVAAGIEVEGRTDEDGFVSFEPIGHGLILELVRPDWVEAELGPRFAGPSDADGLVRLVWALPPKPPRVEANLVDGEGRAVVSAAGLAVEVRWPGGSFALDPWGTGPDGQLRFELPDEARGQAPVDLFVRARTAEGVFAAASRWGAPPGGLWDLENLVLHPVKPASVELPWPAGWAPEPPLELTSTGDDGAEWVWVADAPAEGAAARLWRGFAPLQRPTSFVLRQPGVGTLAVFAATDFEDGRVRLPAGWEADIERLRLAARDGSRIRLLDERGSAQGEAQGLELLVPREGLEGRAWTVGGPGRAAQSLAAGAWPGGGEDLLVDLEPARRVRLRLGGLETRRAAAREGYELWFGPLPADAESGEEGLGAGGLRRIAPDEERVEFELGFSGPVRFEWRLGLGAATAVAPSPGARIAPPDVVWRGRLDAVPEGALAGEVELSPGAWPALPLAGRGFDWAGER